MLGKGFECAWAFAGLKAESLRPSGRNSEASRPVPATIHWQVTSLVGLGATVPHTPRRANCGASYVSVCVVIGHRFHSPSRSRCLCVWVSCPAVLCRKHRGGRGAAASILETRECAASCWTPTYMRPDHVPVRSGVRVPNANGSQCCWCCRCVSLIWPHPCVLRACKPTDSRPYLRSLTSS